MFEHKHMAHVDHTSQTLCMEQSGGQTACAGGTTAEAAVQARHSTPFDVLAVQFDSLSGLHLAVTGLRTVQAGVSAHLA